MFVVAGAPLEMGRSVLTVVFSFTYNTSSLDYSDKFSLFSTSLIFKQLVYSFRIFVGMLVVC